MPAIYKVVGYKRRVGPLRQGRILGSEVTYPTPLTTFQEDHAWATPLGEGRNGVMGKVVNRRAIVLIEFDGPVLGERRNVVGKQINTDKLTKDRFYYEP